MSLLSEGLDDVQSVGLDIALKKDQWAKLDRVKSEVMKVTDGAKGGLYFLGGSLLVLAGVLWVKRK